MGLKIGASLATKIKAPQVLEKVQGGSKDFKEILAQQKEIHSKTPDMFKEIQEMQKSILNGKELSGKDLILYQIKTGQYSLRVELISKVAEAAVSTVKKFQTPQ